MRSLSWLGAGEVAFTVASVTVVVGAWAFGLGPSIVNLALVLYVPIALATRTIALFRRELEWDFARRPFAAKHRAALVQLVVRWTFLVVWGGVLRLNVVPAELGELYPTVMVTLYGGLVVAAVLQLVPRYPIFVPGNVVAALLAIFWGAQCVVVIAADGPSGAVMLDAPLRSEMLVVQGGVGPLVNQHAFTPWERHALDIALLDRGELRHGDRSALSSYACFGSSVHAPADGVVVKAFGDLSDTAPGARDRDHPLGNYVVIEIAAERFVVIAHLQRGSLLVRAGDRVRCGDVLARCGNSGDTTEPHLQLQVQDRADVFDPETRTFPVAIREVTRIRGGDVSLVGAFAVRAGDRLLAAPSSCH